MWSDSHGTMGMIWRMRVAGVASESSQRASTNGGGSFANNRISRMTYVSQSTISSSESAKPAGAGGAAPEEEAADTEETAGAGKAAPEQEAAAAEEVTCLCACAQSAVGAADPTNTR